jgi:hypothetical protein
MPEPPQIRSPRYTIVLPVLYALEESVPPRNGVGWTSELSEGGACLELPERLDLLTPLGLTLRTYDGDIELGAKVVWTAETGPSEGGIFHGVSFTYIAADQHRALRELIRTKGQVRNAGVRLPVELTVVCGRKGDPVPSLQGRTGDISRAGLLLRLPQTLPAGTPLQVTLQTSQGPLTAQGTIIWAGQPTSQAPGELIRHGFRFTDMGWFSELALGHLLAGRL